jgi:unsaturated chondroitin disaccharide hydrolase
MRGWRPACGRSFSMRAGRESHGWVKCPQISFPMEHCLPADGVPYYDFDAPMENGPARDSSAAAIVASALLELAGLAEAGEVYRELAVDMLNMLASPQYLALGHPEQSLLRHGSHSHSGQDKGLIYGDYYFLEAIARWLAE